MENRVQRRSSAPLLQDEEDQNCAEIRSLFTPCTYEACLRVVFLIICLYYPLYNLVTTKLTICRAITYIACILLLFSIAPQPLTLTHVRKLFQAVSFVVEWDLEFEDMDESAFEKSKQAIAEVVAHEAGVDPSAVIVSFTPTTAGVTRRRLTNGIVKAKIEVSDSSADESMAESLASVTTTKFSSELASRVENPPTISAISTPKVEEELDWWNLIIFGIIVILVVTNSILWEIHFAPEEKYCKSIRISKLREVCYISLVCILRGSMFILLNLALLLQAIRISDDDTNIISLSIEDTDVQNIVTEIRRHTFRLRQKSNGLTGIWWLMFLLPWVCFRVFAFYINALDAHTRGDHLCLAFWLTDILQTAMSLTILQKLGKVGKRCREEVCRYEEKHCVFIKEKEEFTFQFIGSLDIFSIVLSLVR